MITVVLVLWLIAISIQLVYIVFIYSRTALHRTPDLPVGQAAQTGTPMLSATAANPLLTTDVPGSSLSGITAAGRPSSGMTMSGTAVSGMTMPGTAVPGTAVPGVTVIVCAWNERENLEELLPLLDQQIYPEFEVLVMDDRSRDGTLDYLEEVTTQLQHVRYLRIDREHEHVTPKKYALTIALKKARHPVVLLTDADCRPASPHWIAGMAAHLSKAGTEIVLGVSPYHHQPGLLNWVIRSETLFTAVQYLSLALAGRPYMGVGRNLMYRRSVFFDNRGFYSHMRILGGDDDLFINEAANARNTAVSLHEDTFTWSAPKETWREWRHQKRRHLSVGRLYKPAHKLRLGLLTGSHVMTWLLAGVMTALVPFVTPTTLLWVALGLFGFRLLAFWLVVGRISYRLSRTVGWYTLSLMDALLSLYYIVMGVATFFRRRRKLAWR
ncbi:glycosyltransferase [Nibrella saemangeumensis]|uniref:Glycosyltransferase n=1 Tax=Nibrella saemangeumensis TaxID=1084526 RepID=A0ABP8N2P9_9BACT